jgi:hypothetical protein
MSDPLNQSLVHKGRLAGRDGLPSFGAQLRQLARVRENLASVREFRGDTGSILARYWNWIWTPTPKVAHGDLPQIREATYASVRKAHATAEWWYWTACNILLGHPVLSFIFIFMANVAFVAYLAAYWNDIGRSFDLISPYYWYKQHELHELYHTHGYR